jgi:ATP-dependent DNA helicase Q1
MTGLNELNHESATPRYFSASANLDVSAWSADGTAALERCGHCDNCLRDSTSHKCEDKTLEAWQVLKIAEEVYNLKGNVTIAGLAVLAGGKRQAKIKVKQRKGPSTDVPVDVDKVAGGKVKLTVSVSHAPISLCLLINQFLDIEKETEILIIQLIVEGYLTPQVQQTQYTSYAYLIPSLAALRITRYAREDIAKCDYSVQCYFPIKVRKTANGKTRALSDDEDPPPQGTTTSSGARPQTKRKREEVDDQEDDENVIEISSDVVYEDDEILEADSPHRSLGGQKLLDSGAWGVGSRPDVVNVDSDPEGWSVADSEEDNGWSYSHMPKPRQRRRTKSPPTMADLSDF